VPRYPGGINIAWTASNNLMSRLEMKELTAPGAFALYGDGNAIHECEMHLLSDCGIWSALDTASSPANQRNSVIGNYLHDMESTEHEHALRIQGCRSSFVGFNVFEADGTKSGIQIRGNATHVVLFGNVLDRATGFHPQYQTAQEEIHHCIAEANIFMGRVDPVSGEIDAAYLANNNSNTVADSALEIGAHDICIRNNIFYNYNHSIALQDYTPTIPITTRVSIENNTMIKTLVNSNFEINRNATSITLLNNLLSSTATTNNQYDQFLDSATSSFNGTSDNNQMFGTSWSASWHFFGYYPDVSLAQWQQSSGNDIHSMYADPGISVMDPVTTGFAAPTANSPGVNKGTATGGWLDLYGRMRDAQPDIGAIEYLP
jgi:hypothetical protein